MEGKKCTGPCGQMKSPEEFSKDRHRRDGNRKQCKTCESERVSRWRQENSGRTGSGPSPETRAAYKDRVREKVFGHYGTTCACCGTVENLTIDHVEGGGNDHRKALSMSGSGLKFYEWLVRENLPDGYQVLCRPCNRSKASGERCRLHAYC